MRYDALLLLSFGGPEKPEDVFPFLENVTRGRNVPRARLESVAEHYYHFGGISPINQQCRELTAGIEALFKDSGPGIPVYWGNRNWHPLVTDTLRQMTADGVRRAAAFVTSAYSGYSSCRQYLEDIDRARVAAGPDAPEIDKLRVYFNHPGFVEPMIDNTRAAFDRLPEGLRDDARLVFTAHSVPLDQPGRATYVAQLTDVAGVVAQATGRAGATSTAGRSPGVSPDLRSSGSPWDLVYQSRSGPPEQRWLEPDIGDHLENLSRDGTVAAVIVPIGFVSDHLEVKYDLDFEAAQLAARLGMTVERAATAMTDPRFVAMVRDLVLERADPDPAGAAGTPRRLTWGTLGPRPDSCPAGCCLPERS